MIIRSKAPLRLGLGGGGTDVSPYSEEYGGCTLSTTINLYSYCSLEPLESNKIEIYATDINKSFKCESISRLEIDTILPLHKGIYNRIIEKYNKGKPLSFRMITFSDALPGSGLGSSSTMVVAILRAFIEWLKLPLGEYDIANLAYEIERIDLKLKGGKQDQYSATFGGINFMEYNGKKVLVNPLRVRDWIKFELEDSIVLYYTGQSRDSSSIIEEQIRNTTIKDIGSLNAMHEIKRTAIAMKEAVLTGDIQKFIKWMNKGWESKKNASGKISNTFIDDIYTYAMQNGALAGKISGAGGGGFFMFFVDASRMVGFKEAMKKKGGGIISPKFEEKGSVVWTVDASLLPPDNFKS